MSKETSCFGEMFLSFAAGTLIGVGIAVLLAPQSGEQTRKQLRDVASNASSKGAEIYDDAKELYEHVKDEIVKTVDERLASVGFKHKEEEEKKEV